MVGVLVMVAGVYWVYRLVFPPDRVVIRKQLHELAGEVSFRNEGNSPLALLAGVNRLLGYFTRDVEIRLGDTPGVRNRVVRGRDELREAIAGTRASQNAVQVRLREVFIDRIEGQQALVQIIVSIRIDSETDATIHEFRLRMVKEGRQWLIRLVEPVVALDM